MEILKKSNDFVKLKEVNKSLNVIKCLAVFAVICIHCSLFKLGLFGEGIDALSRFAVPLFFLISGYYSYFKDNNYAMIKYKNRSIKLIKLLFLSNLAYLLIFFYNNHFNFDVVCSTICDLTLWINLAVFNDTPVIFGSHLWFIISLIYCYALFVILKNFSFSISRLYKYIPILLLINIIFGEIFCSIGIHINYIYYRNFLFTGLPFFLLGYLIHDKQDYLNIFSNKFLCYVILLSSVITIFELILTHNIINLYVGTIFLATSIFLWCILNPNRLDFKIMGYIGGKLYTYIYVLHPIIVGFVSFRFNLGYLNPFIVFGITTLVSSFIYILLMENLKFYNYCVFKTTYFKTCLLWVFK